jgi:uncharacterized protein with GYD domain
VPTYILFVNYTDQGIRDIKNSPARTEAYKQSLEYKGEVKILGLYRMMGPYDLITIVEAACEEPIMSVALKISSVGNVKVQFYRLYNDQEFSQIVANLEK